MNSKNFSKKELPDSLINVANSLLNILIDRLVYDATQAGSENILCEKSMHQTMMVVQFETNFMREINAAKTPLD